MVKEREEACGRVGGLACGREGGSACEEARTRAWSAQLNISHEKSAADIWNEMSPSTKHRYALWYSSIMPSTAGCIEPSGPRNASPGPIIESSVVFITAISSRHMAVVVTSK